MTEHDNGEPIDEWVEETRALRDAPEPREEPTEISESTRSDSPADEPDDE